MWIIWLFRSFWGSNTRLWILIYWLRKIVPLTTFQRNRTCHCWLLSSTRSSLICRRRRMLVYQNLTSLSTKTVYTTSTYFSDPGAWLEFALLCIIISVFERAKGWHLTFGYFNCNRFFFTIFLSFFLISHLIRMMRSFWPIYSDSISSSLSANALNICWRYSNLCRPVHCLHLTAPFMTKSSVLCALSVHHKAISSSPL